MADKSKQIINRNDPGYRDVGERLADFNEVERTLSEEEVKLQALRCLSCGTPFCHGYACPLGNNIPEANALIAQERWKDALKLLLSTHPFPEFTARICPALCEGSCVLGIHEEAVSIRQIEKMIIELAFARGWIKPRLPHRRLPQRVAVIGSGPAGLTVAELLNQKGYQVTVFEKDLHPGGLLTYGIPNFKLDKQIVMRRIKLMQEEGIIFECGINAGSDVSFNYLQKHFSAVVLAGGASKPRDLSIPGRDLKGIHLAMDLLKAQNRHILKEEPEANVYLSARDKDVAVIGGGDTGSDCLGTVLRQGARNVFQLEIMPRLGDKRGSDNPWPLFPRIDRLSSSHREGGERLWCVDTLAFTGDQDGRVQQLQCCEVEWVEDGNNKVPVRKKGTEFIIEAELVLLALGFTGPGPDPLAEALDLERDERGNILVNDRHMTSRSGVFSAGDIARGQSLVVQAMADGAAAAKHVGQYLAD